MPRSMLRGLLKSLPILSLLFVTSAWAQGGLVGPPNQIICNRTASLSPTSVNSLYTVIQGVVNKNIFICGWHFTTQSAATTQSFAIGVATGITSQTCAAGMNSLTPSISVSGTAPSADHIDYATMTTSALSQSLCVGVQNATNISGVIWYAQF